MNSEMSDNRIVMLNTDDYFFLTENFEFADKTEIKSAISYIIINKRKNLQKILHTAIENELNEIERKVIRYYYYDELDLNTIAVQCGISRSGAYRKLNSALEKLRRPLKYLIEYDGYSCNLKADELIRSIREGNI